ncbi:MAG: isochorismatase family protein [Thiohalomonadaceae bacterium]
MSLLCAAASSQLVIIDIQTRLAAVMPPEARERVLKNTTILLQAANSLEIPLTLTEQYPQGLGSTENVLLQHLTGDSQTICKTCFAASGANEFNQTLDSHTGRHQVILVGMEAHICVLQTAMGLLRHGYQIFIAEDAVSSRKDRHRENALARLRQGGAIISNTESILFEWLRDASNPQFKALSALIK